MNKGIEELVEAASALVKEFPDLQLRVIGKGAEKYVKQLREKARSLGAPDLLTFRGFLDKDELPKELSQAHIFAAPSYYEGGPGFVYLEAMGCGLPVVGCTGSGVGEIVVTGETGILVPPKDSIALEEALRKILSDKKLLNSMGMNAREYVRKEADSRNCVRKLEAYYKLIIQNHKQAAEIMNYG